MFLILALGSLYTITYQNVSATGEEIVSNVIEINNNTANGPVLNDYGYFGSSIANIGDLNGDGISDIAVGAEYDDGDGASSGAIHVMFMNSNGSVSSTIEINNNTANGPVLNDDDRFGSSIANIGDLNGDDISDIAVGAYADDVGGTNSGDIHVMFMNSNGSVSRTIKINNNTANGPVLNDDDGFGRSIANIGDLNADGISDIAVGAYADDAGGTARGAIHVMFMNSNGSVSNTIEINNNTANGPALNDGDIFGRSIANIGDLNGDGTFDIAVGASGDDAGGPNRGAIHVLFMNSNGSVSSTIEINNNTANGPVLNDADYFGISIANIGDLNGDSISDIAVGAHYDDAGGAYRGTIHVMLMNSNGTVSNTIEINNNTANGPVLNDYDNFGISIANIGDLNNDGTLDIAVGADYDDAGGTNRGAIHVLFMADIIPPTITNITSNTTSSGVLKVGDTISFTLTLDSAENGATINGTYNSVPLSWNRIDNGTTYTATYIISEGDADQIKPLQITGVTITDSAGNTSLPFDGTDILDTIDANSPQFSSAQTISISQIAITLDQSVTDSTATPNDFTLEGVTGGSINSIVSVLNDIITLDITGAAISDSDDVTISYTRTSGSIDDVSGNSLLDFAENVANNLDTTPPMITLIGDNPQIIEQGAGYTELNATTNDSSTITINSTNFTDVVGNYTIYYDSIDTAGNNAIQVSRTVNVVDTTPPTFVSAALNEGTGTLTITFSEIINASSINSIGFSIRDNNTSTSTITLSTLELTTTANGAIISFNMTMANRLSVIAFTVSVLDISTGAVQDINGNVITLSANNTITTTSDTIPPTLTFTSITPNNGTLGIGDDIVIQINANNETGLTLLSGTINNETIILSETTPTLSETTPTSSFDYRKTITINNTMVSGSAEHTNFPLLVSIQNDPNLNNATVQASGQDIRFTTINDTPLHYEITSFSNNHTSGNLSAWIMIPTLYASNDTKIYMYYSNSIVTDGQNATAVWDSDYDGVWHFDGDMLDSTSNDNDGTNFNSTGTTGIIGGARSFDGNDYISYSDSEFPSGNNPRTLSAWVNHASLPVGFQGVLVYGTEGIGQAYGLFQNSSNLIVGGYGDDITLNTTPTTNDWYHFAMTYDGATVRTYIDGSPDANGTKSWSTVLNEFRVGQQVNNLNEFFTGQIDEIRISDTVRTADWIKTEYNNQNSGSFYSVSAPEKLVMSFYYDLTYTVAEGDTDIVDDDDTTAGITYNITLVDTAGNPTTLAATIPSISSPGVDANSPIITLNGLTPQIIEQGAGYTELDAITNDGSTITINSANFTDAIGTYHIYYDSTDTAGNNAIQVSRTVNVVDTTPPVITLNGTNPQTIEQGEGYTELGAITNDSSTITINSANFTDLVGTYYIYYDSTDAFNNTAQVIRTVNVVDTTAPVITLNGTNPQTIEQGAGYTELGAITNDSSTITINSTNFTDLVGTYTIYYDSTDASNNTAIQVIRTVNVVDTTPPTFVSTVLNEGTGTLTITFSEIINASSINSIGFSIRDNNTSTSTITLSTLELTTTANGTTISFNMTMVNRQSVIAFNVLVLDIGAGAVRDISGNTIIMSTDNPIATTLDTIPPTLTFTSITPNNGILGIGDDIVIQINANNETGLTLLSGTINNETIILSETTPTSSFGYRKTITINNIMVSGSAEHTNFPLLVSIQNDPNLNNATVQASGQDIRFTTINDTPLYYEITSFSNNHTSGNLSAWIMIPTLYASNDTKIYMYYSNSIVTDGQNATAVWDSDYDGVWHFDGDMLDSTSNDNDGTNSNSTGTTGIIGGARSFDGDDYILYRDSEFPSGNNPRTLSAWVNHASLPVGFQGVLVYGTEGIGQAYGLFQNSSNLIVGGYGDDITLNTTPTTNDWYHFAMTYDGATVRTYIDGSPDITGTKSWSTELNEFRVGQQVNNLKEFFTGQIDEIRISDTVRTADWIKTEYNNQNSGSFYSVSAPEKLVMSFYYDLTYTVAEGDTDINDATAGIAYNITLVDTAGNPTTLAATIPSISSPGVDANSPIITLNGLTPQIIEQGAGYTELDAITNDGSTITINSANFTDAIGTYHIYYDSTDTAGNTANQVNRTVIVSDTTPPVITLNGANPQIIELGDGYTELNATTNDDSPITINSANFTDLVGTYYIYYDSTDAFNNTAQVIRTVNVVDNTLPVFSSAVLNEGTGIFTIAFNKTINVSTINSTGLSIRDNNTSIDAVTLSTLELITTANDTTISFNMTLVNRQSVIAFTTSVLDIGAGAVQDIYGNQIVATTGNPIATTFDTIPPVISLLGNNPQTIEQGAGYTELGATTNDNSTITINSANFTDLVGTYHIYYDSTDASNNTAIQVIRTVNVVDTTPPVITLNGANPQTIELGDGYTELNATTNDDSPITINSANFTDTLGTYTIYYDSVDASGNSAIQVNRTVIVSDTTPSDPCVIPDSGDWIITNSCTLDANADAPESVIVQNGSVLNIPSGITLDIDFTTFNLTVQSGGGVLIKSGGTLT